MMLPKTERILVTVKAYPIASSRYVELVCTAGLREDGSWLRIYPVPFRTLPELERYRKFDIIEGKFFKNEKDSRPESYRPVDHHGIKIISHVGTAQSWFQRRQMILDRAVVYDDLDLLIQEARSNITSLAVFKPTKITKFEARVCTDQWKEEKLRSVEKVLMQNDLFHDNSWRTNFTVVEKLPYDFYYQFEDKNGKLSKMKILDWEIGALYRKCLHRAQGDTQAAIEDVRQKYTVEFKKTDLHFFLGTTQRFHKSAPNPFTIVGVFPIPPQPLDLWSVH